MIEFDLSVSFFKFFNKNDNPHPFSIRIVVSLKTNETASLFSITKIKDLVVITAMENSSYQNIWFRLSEDKRIDIISIIYEIMQTGKYQPKKFSELTFEN